MRFSTATASVAALLALASVTKAQDANCSAILNDYAPNGNGAYAKCYTDQVYNAALVAQGNTPNYKDLINQVCGKPACTHSNLQSGISKYIKACNASINTEASNGNILQLGKTALEIYFAEPIHAAYCAVDPNAPVPTPATPNTPVPPTYCLSNDVANPASRFVSNLAVYLTSGSIRSSQSPFFQSNNLDPKDVCSDCSKVAMNATIEYLAQNLMPSIAPFYTPEFVQYWTKLVPAYNDFCKSSFTQVWPAGTLNVTIPNVPTGSPSPPTTNLPTATATAPATASPTGTKPSGAGVMKPAAGAAVALLMAVAALL
ncbi:hypothetical protein EDD11_006122 [Mortierella claussenii]|nr:hypothetical protein EDD11_006122 [Mortierella claussenii]